VQGIFTNLKSNDLLLMNFDDGSRELLRVMEVTPDAAADRTLIKLRGWTVGAGSGTAAVREIAEVFCQAHEFGVSLGPTAEGVIRHLEALIERLDSPMPEEEKLGFLEQVMLPTLTNELAGLQPQATRLRQWLRSMVDELSSASKAIANALRETRSKVSQLTSPDVLIGTGVLFKHASIPPASPQRLTQSITALTKESEAIFQAINVFLPDSRTLLPLALKHASVTEVSALRAQVFRVKAALFGHNLPGQPVFERDNATETIVLRRYNEPTLSNTWQSLITELVGPERMVLDAEYEQIQPGSLVIIERPVLNPNGEVVGCIRTRHTVTQVQTETMTAFGISARVTQLTMEPSWLSEVSDSAARGRILRSPLVLRGTVVYAQSEELPLAEEPIEKPICGTDGEIELDGLYDGLQAGRWLIVSGERTDIPGTSGVKAAELVMLSEVRHDVRKSNEGTTDLPGDKLHTFIKLATDPAYCYKRDTVKIYGNVVKATHGETRREALGSGDGSKTLQQFTLKQPPLTYVSSPNPSGVESTLQVFVNDMQWHAADMLAGLGPTDRRFLTRTDDEGKTTILSGNGREGARLPTGMENVRAVYRNGIGKAGNVKAEQISMLGDRPLGVKEVINPLPASGGADKESRDQARQNAPLAVMALDRLVSTQDYTDFARTFAGISKASAVRLSDGRQQLVHLTVAGVDDIPIDEHSDLHRNLRVALRRCGDPYQPLRIDRRELILLVIRANVRVQPDVPWESVKEKLRMALLKTFSFECCELGQDVRLSKAISVMQCLKGVEYVDVDVFGGVPEKKVKNNKREFLTPTDIAAEIQKMAAESQVQGPAHRVRVPLASVEGGQLRPAHIAYLAPATLILNEVSR
jgi:hypothetical protein